MRDLGSAICLDCRTLLDDASCDETAHHAVSLEGDAGRSRLLAAVWGEPRVVSVPRPWRERYYWAFWRSGAGIFATLLACLPFSACSDHPLDELVSFRMWAFIAVILAIVLPALLIEGWSEHAAERRATTETRVWEGDPRGVPLLAPRKDGLSGVVTSAGAEVSPLSGRRAAAWAVWLVRGDGILLRVARSAELEVRLDDGQRLRVPAGRVRFDERGPRRAVPRERVQGLLDRVGIGGGGGKDDPFPCSEAWDCLLSTGDRVTVFAELVRQPVAGDGAEAYRAEPEHELVAQGVPTLLPDATELQAP